MAFISQALKVQDLSTLSALTNATNGITDGSFRLVVTTPQGPAWYRYFTPSTLPVTSPLIVSGESGRWLRVGDKILTGTSAPASAPPYAGAFFVNLSNGKFYYATNNTSSADWLAISALFNNGVYGDLTVSNNGNTIKVNNFEALATPSIASGVLTLDLSLAYYFRVSFNSNITSFNVVNAPVVANSILTFAVILDYSGAQRTLPATSSTIQYNGSAAPITPSGSGQMLQLIFQSTNATNYWISSNSYGY